MRIWIHQHPILLSMMVAVLAAAAAVGAVFYYLGSWLILPLI